MRDLIRNKRTLYYAAMTGTDPILDEYGNETLEERTLYSEPVRLKCNVSANAGQEVVEAFGSQTEYSRTVSITGGVCPLSEGYRVWFGVGPEKANNYVVARVADSKNGYLIALREVTPS